MADEQVKLIGDCPERVAFDLMLHVEEYYKARNMHDSALPEANSLLEPYRDCYEAVLNRPHTMDLSNE